MLEPAPHVDEQRAGPPPAGDAEYTFRRHLRRAMALPAVVLALCAVVLVAMVLYLQHLNRGVDRTDVIIGRANLLEKLAIDREAGLSSYLLSGDHVFLDPFNAADARISQVVDGLEDLVSDDPSLVARLLSMRVEVVRWRQYAAQQMDRKRDGASYDAIAFHLREGKEITDDIRSRLEAFIQIEEELRDRRLLRADDVTRNALAAGVALAVLLGGIVAVATARQMRSVRRRYRDALEEQKRAEASLRESEMRLRAADRRKNEFLGMLSHELRNPLAPIRNSVFVIDHAEPGSEQDRRARGVIARQVEHLTRLVEDLLEVKRISAGKMRLDPERIDVVKPVRETVEDMRPLFAKRAISLDLQVPRDPVWVHGDTTRLAQVVGNLLHNASKFNDAGGHVLVAVETEDGTARVRVRDDGVGIAPEVLSTLFDPFVQGESTIHRSRGGLGLGLALVRGVVELHGGTVAASSEGPGKGAEFVVSLPVIEPAAASMQMQEASPRAVSRRRILIVEDNEDAAVSLRDLLELDGGHEVHVASDGAAGIDAARRLRPDVVLCDIGLPVVDGYEVARQLRADPGRDGAMLVALSGYASPEDVERSLEAGFRYHVAKPPNLDDLVRIIQESPCRSRAAA